LAYSFTATISIGSRIPAFIAPKTFFTIAGAWSPINRCNPSAGGPPCATRNEGREPPLTAGPEFGAGELCLATSVRQVDRFDDVAIRARTVLLGSPIEAQTFI